MRFSPKILESLKDYDRAKFAADLGAGVTVGVIALPLAIGFAIASGVTPAQGIWTAIVAGFLISALGGSKVQVGGPTGAFVPLLAGIVASHGYGGLAMATIMAGMALVLMGWFRLGALIKFIPYPVIAGFTSGIAVIIFVGQIREFLGIEAKLPSHAPHQMIEMARHLAETSLPTLGLGVLALAILLLWPRIKALKAIPASIVAVVVTSVCVAAFHPDVATIGSRFGGIPRGLPPLTLPTFDFAQIRELMIPAMTIAILGAIESLLSAIVADGLIEERHDSNQELIGQGVANLVSPLFGGISATGAIARTMSNIRSGARTPVAGILHSVTLLAFVLLAAPLANYIPLAALSAVLFVVAFRMGEWDNFREMARGTKSDLGVMLATFGLTIVFDLTVAVGVGLAMAAVLFVRRMEEITHIRLVTPESDLDVAGTSVASRPVPEGVVIYRIEGPFFFGAAEKLETALARASAQPRIVIFRMRNVPAIDASGLHALEIALEKFARKDVRLILSGVQPQPMKLLYNSGFIEEIGLENVCANLDEALVRAAALTEG